MANSIKDEGTANPSTPSTSIPPVLPQAPVQEVRFDDQFPCWDDAERKRVPKKVLFVSAGSEWLKSNVIHFAGMRFRKAKKSDEGGNYIYWLMTSVAVDTAELTAGTE